MLPVLTSCRKKRAGWCPPRIACRRPSPTSLAGRQAKHGPPHSLRQRLSLFDVPLGSIHLLQRRASRKQERIQSDRPLEVRHGGTPALLGIIAARSDHFRAPCRQHSRNTAGELAADESAA